MGGCYGTGAGVPDLAPFEEGDEEGDAGFGFEGFEGFEEGGYGGGLADDWGWHCFLGVGFGEDVFWLICRGFALGLCFSFGGCCGCFL